LNQSIDDALQKENPDGVYSLENARRTVRTTAEQLFAQVRRGDRTYEEALREARERDRKYVRTGIGTDDPSVEELLKKYQENQKGWNDSGLSMYSTQQQILDRGRKYLPAATENSMGP